MDRPLPDSIEPEDGVDLKRADARLLQIVDSALSAGASRAGSWLACRPGCTECCIGPFPITRLDAWRLRRGLEELSGRDPARAEGIRARARAAAGRLEEGFPGEARRGLLDGGDDGAEDRFLDRHATLPCPALIPGEGVCGLYAHRPMTCRTFGPPVKLWEEELPPCRLCFDGAPAEVVAACCVEPDPGGEEEAILETLAARDGEERETLIAFALATPLQD
jgi:Fe-S-cluster containining protein